MPVQISTGVRRVRRVVSPTVHRVLDRGLQSTGERRFRAAVDAVRPGDPVRLNIGAGRKAVAGWINTDVVWQGHVYLDATRPWPVALASVDLVYADNVIEHVTKVQGREVFRHAFAALRPGGVFRLATPDVEAVARQYLDNGELARQGMERNRERGRDFDHPVELIRQVFVGAKHYLGFCYDFAALQAEMAAAGFVVTRVAAGHSDHPDLRGLEVRMHPAEEATSLIVEGRRP